MLKQIHNIITWLGERTAQVMTWILIPLVYWIPFALTALILKLFRQRMLPHYSHDAKSYWLPAPEVSKQLERMKRQF